MKKLIYHVATTLDGFIARLDHSIGGFITEGDHVGDYLDSLKSDYDTVLMGRRTYEFGFQFGVTDPYPLMRQYVISRTMSQSPNANVFLISEKLTEFVADLKKEDGKSIYLCGGAELASTLLLSELIDEIIIKLNPVVFGAGLPLFSGPVSLTPLKLMSSKVYESGVLRLQYAVKSALS